ncbi:hypothetical protein ACIBG5_22435 [Kribbella sp. NPDC050241]
MKRPSFVEAALALARSWLATTGPERDTPPPPADANGDRPEEDDVPR